MLYLLLIVAVMALDRIVKIAVSSHMAPGDTIPVLEHIFHITYVQNTGAAFSMLQGHPTLLIVLPAVVLGIGVIFICVMSKAYNKVFLTSVSLICGGGLGNLTDRIAQGYVVDMFDFRVFPVFNVADIAVCTGCGLLILYMIIDANRSKSGGQTDADGSQNGKNRAKTGDRDGSQNDRIHAKAGDRGGAQNDRIRAKAGDRGGAQAGRNRAQNGRGGGKKKNKGKGNGKGKGRR